jgi:hypothetical protein
MAGAPETPSPAIDAAIARLYHAPLEEFMELRKALALELRTQGDKAGAAEVAKANKPAPTAWAINQVAIHHPHELRLLAEAIEALRAAHGGASEEAGGGAQPFAAARASLNDRAWKVVRLAREAMAKGGQRWSPEAQRRILQTLHAMPFAPPEELARLRAGRLVKDLDAAADFGALAASLGPAFAPRATTEAAREEPPEPHVPAAHGHGEKRSAPASAEEKRRAREQESARLREEATRRAEERARKKALEEEARAAEREVTRREAEAARAEAIAAKARAEADAARAAVDRARAVAREARARAEGTALGTSE